MTVKIVDNACKHGCRGCIVMRVDKVRLAATGLVSEYVRLVAFASVAVCAVLPAFAAQVAASNVGTAPVHQVDLQVDRLNQG
ncbi:hypothetical protein ACT2FY_07800 [Paraburkholderia fungorum]|uniref:hypothetical protein n=1 Tax=Paraburkholderia fungorum TaxID=134537 RepID=UPI00402B236D